MEIFMCVLLGVLSMLILLHYSVLLLIAAAVWKRREKKDVPEEAAEKTEEERRAEMEMKVMTCITICTIVNLIWVESSHNSSCYSCNILKVSSSLFCS